jgi:hypothetical protein
MNNKQTSQLHSFRITATVAQSGKSAFRILGTTEKEAIETLKENQVVSKIFSIQLEELSTLREDVSKLNVLGCFESAQTLEIMIEEIENSI